MIETGPATPMSLTTASMMSPSGRTPSHLKPRPSASPLVTPEYVPLEKPAEQEHDPGRRKWISALSDGLCVIDAEREFELNTDGHELVGYIDAVYRTPDDELLVIDYKATERHCDLEDDKQLPIYLLACRDLYDEPVARAGYAYVGDVGPKIESRTFSDGDLEAVRDGVTESMNRIVEFSFSRYTAGEHCQWCQHNRLPCAPDSVQSE